MLLCVKEILDIDVLGISANVGINLVSSPMTWVHHLFYF